MLVFARHLVWRMVRIGVWAQATNFEEQTATSCDVLSSGLKKWFRDRHQRLPHEELTRIPFKRKTIG